MLLNYFQLIVSYVYRVYPYILYDHTIGKNIADHVRQKLLEKKVNLNRIVNYTTGTASNMMAAVQSHPISEDVDNNTTDLTDIIQTDEEDFALELDPVLRSSGGKRDLLNVAISEVIICNRTGCVAHIANLVCKSCEDLPFIAKALELNRNLYAQFKGSNNRAELRKRCKDGNYRMETLVQNIAVRWMSVKNSLTRVVELWNILRGMQSDGFLVDRKIPTLTDYEAFRDYEGILKMSDLRRIKCVLQIIDPIADFIVWSQTSSKPIGPMLIEINGG